MKRRQEKILKKYFVRAEKIRNKEKNQNNIDYDVFFIFKIVKAVSREIQKTIKFYSIVYVHENED